MMVTLLPFLTVTRVANVVSGESEPRETNLSPIHFLFVRWERLGSLSLSFGDEPPARSSPTDRSAGSEEGDERGEVHPVPRSTFLPLTSPYGSDRYGRGKERGTTDEPRPCRGEPVPYSFRYTSLSCPFGPVE